MKKTKVAIIAAIMSIATCMAQQVAPSTPEPTTGGVLVPVVVPPVTPVPGQPQFIARFPASLEEAWVMNTVNIRQGAVGAFGASVLNGSKGSTYSRFTVVSEGLDLPAVDVAIKSAVLEFPIVGISDIKESVWLFDKGGYPLFSGQEQADIKQIGADGVVRLTVPRIKMRINDTMRIPYPGVYGATFSRIDKWGNLTDTVWLEGQQGFLEFPVGFIGNVNEYVESGETSPVDYKLVVSVNDSVNGYHEDVYVNGSYQFPQPAKLETNAGLDMFVSAGVDPEVIELTTTEDRPQFCAVFTISESKDSRRVIIRPSKGVRTVRGGQKTVTVARSGLLLDQDGVRLSKINVSDEGQSLSLPPGTYALILDKWEDRSFGDGFMEYHAVPTSKSVGGKY